MVWTLTLQPESEGPSLISYAARLLSGGHCGLLSAPSWRTIIGVSFKWSIGMIFLHPLVEGMMHKQIRK